MIAYLNFWIMIASFCCAFEEAPRLKSAALDEVSGVVCGSEGILYVHNDSGDSSRFYAISPDGELLATMNFSGDPKKGKLGVEDCEDIAIGPGPEGKSYIYLGDIGDNGGNRGYVTVYRFLEPVGQRGVIQIGSSALHLKYPNGPQDAEAMMVDAVSRELIIVSKRQDTVGIYSAPIDFRDGDTVVLKKRGGLFLGGTQPGRLVVAADISRDGSQVLIKSYAGVYHWRRKGQEPICETLRRRPVQLPYQMEPQGEAIGFNVDGRGYYCISEGKNPRIYHYKMGR